MTSNANVQSLLYLTQIKQIAINNKKTDKVGNKRGNK